MYLMFAGLRSWGGTSQFGPAAQSQKESAWRSRFLGLRVAPSPVLIAPCNTFGGALVRISSSGAFTKLSRPYSTWTWHLYMAWAGKMIIGMP